MMLLPVQLRLVVLLLASVVSSAPTSSEDKPSIWQFHIFRGPAPPPDSPLSPPGAAGALRDRSKLKYEIIGIVGAYVVWTIITLLLIFFIGVKLRRRAQSSNPTLSMEMLKTAGMTEKSLPSPGPLSPGKMASLKSWASRNKHKKSPSTGTTSTIDTRLVEEDKQKNMDEMAKLYAHVMAHEQERESMKVTSSSESSPSSPTNYSRTFYTQPQAMPTPPRSPQYQNPPELQHLRQQAPHPSESPYYYPPPHQASDLQALPRPIPEDDISRATTRVNETPRSFSNRHERTGSNNSNRLQPSRISVRGKPISEPLGDADLSQSVSEAEAIPLSPRLYTPGPAPPTPQEQTARGLPTSPRLNKPVQQPSVPVIDKEIVRRRQIPNPLNFSQGRGVDSSTDNLPFRQIYKDTGMTSAPHTKTTFVRTREDVLGHHPKTGVPQTPYSPYMPMTPMTPVTPSTLATRKDIKRQRKTEQMKVLNEDDMVKSDEEMWGDV